MNAPVRVLFYEPYPMGLGGNFTTQRMILERLDRDRLVAVVVAPVEGAALDVYRKMGIECVVKPPPGILARYGGAITGSGPLARLKAVVDLLRYNLSLARFIRQRKFHVVYANCVRAEMSVGLAARLARVPSLLYVKGELENPIIDRISVLLASKVLFFSTYNRDDYPGIARRFRRKIDILRIGLDPAPIDAALQKNKAALMKELDIDRDRINVVVLGQLYPPKGQHFALQALAKVVKKFPKVRLYFVGDAVIDEYRGYRDELDELVRDYVLEDHVRFTGWRDDALDIVACMDMVIHPSLAEGFGRAVLESMALGVPIVASRVGGLREIVEEGVNGFLVDPGDVDAIAQRWEALAGDAELRERVGRNARRTVLADYLIDDKVERLADIWLEMAGARG